MIDSGRESLDLLRLIRRRIRFLAVNIGVISLVALGVSFLLPKWYSARAVLLPPTEEESALSLSQLLPRGLGGVKLPGAPTLSDLFVSVLKSRTVGDRIVERFRLVDRYGLPDREKALKELDGHTKLSLGDEGTIAISVEDRDPKVAAQMANAYVEELDNFNRLTRTSTARRTRQFIEERLGVVEHDLASAENSLSSYQQRKNVALLSPEARGQAEIGAGIMAQKLALEVKLNVLRQSLVESSEEVRRVKEELTALARPQGEGAAIRTIDCATGGGAHPRDSGHTHRAGPGRGGSSAPQVTPQALPGGSRRNDARRHRWFGLPCCYGAWRPSGGGAMSA